MPQKILEYGLAWSQTRGYFYRIKLEGRPWTPWISVSAGDFAALALIFKEEPIYLQPDGFINTSEEPVG
jgi:hypothetical protein